MGGIPLPNLSASSWASSPFNQNGNAFNWGAGDWIVNMGGSGTTTQNATGSPAQSAAAALTGGASGISPLVWVAVAVVAWAILK